MSRVNNQARRQAAAAQCILQQPAVRGSGPSAVTVILIDGLNTEVLDQRYARQQLLKFLGHLKTEDRFPMAPVPLRSGVWIRLRYGENRGTPHTAGKQKGSMNREPFHVVARSHSRQDLFRAGKQ